MKKFFGVIAALALAMPLAAQAADLPVKAPYIAPVVANWTGFYVGVDGGYGSSASSGSSYAINPAGAVSGTGTVAPLGTVLTSRGGFIGGTAGYNYQIGTWLIGLETDLQWSGIKGSGSATDPCCAPTFTGASGTFSATQSLNWFGTFRGRLGWVATPNLLLYATGGLIYGREDVAASVVFPAATFFGYPSSSSSTRVGATVGGGFEYLFANNLSVKLEGLYYDLGTVTSSFTCPATGTTCTPGFTETGSFPLHGALIRAGLNWHFSPGPIVARY